MWCFFVVVVCAANWNPNVELRIYVTFPEKLTFISIHVCVWFCVVCKLFPSFLLSYLVGNILLFWFIIYCFNLFNWSSFSMHVTLICYTWSFSFWHVILKTLLPILLMWSEVRLCLYVTVNKPIFWIMT